MERPIPPNEGDCCNSGCNPCIFDVYEEQLIKYNANKDIINGINFKNCISETSYTVFKLIDKIPHTKDTCFLIFEYSKAFRGENMEDKHILKLLFKPGQHFLLRAGYNGFIDHFTRAYTPIPFENLKPLHFCILVKLYEVGIMSRYLKKLKIASNTLWRGPYCDFIVDYSFKHVLMIAQGTGITPFYAIIKDMLNNEDCETFIRLYFCCSSCDDILLRDELYKCLSYWNFKYEIFLSDIGKSESKYNEIIHCKKLENENIQSFLKDKNEKSTQVLVCGSENFNEDKATNLIKFDKISKYIF